MTDQPAWPRKTRELHNHQFDSTVWNDVVFRNDDIVIASHAKSGTTWTQQIVAQLLFGGDPKLAVAELSPWLDLRVPPRAVKLAALEAQTHRRLMKTHLPLDALTFSDSAKYLYIARDGRDVLWSLYNHIQSHGLSRLDRQGLARILQQLLALLVQANDRFSRSERAAVQVQQIVHPLPVRFRQSADAPHQLAPRLDAVFLAACESSRG